MIQDLSVHSTISLNPPISVGIEEFMQRSCVHAAIELLHCRGLNKVLNSLIVTGYHAEASFKEYLGSIFFLEYIF